jgi:hypothetical protein
MQFVYAFAMLVASYLLSSLTAPKVQGPKPAAFEDFEFPQIEEGTPQAVCFGDNWTKDWMVLWYGEMDSQAIKGGGGKK